tara:strand:+ start:32388 stop:33014 length:627 start_codon:yes stop_codon:yes gene_type:complete
MTVRSIGSTVRSMSLSSNCSPQAMVSSNRPERTMTNVQIAQPAATTIPKPAAAMAATEQSATVVERFLGLTAAITLGICCLQLEGGHLGDYAQVVTFAMICSLTLGGMIMSHGPRLVARLLAVSFGSRAQDEVESQALSSLCQRGRRLAYTATVVQMIVGIVHVLSVLDQPALIGPGLAVSLTALVIGPLIAEFGFGSAQQWVKRSIQ